MRTTLLIIFLTFFAFASSVFAQQEARKFYEAKPDEIICDDAKAALDNLAIDGKSLLNLAVSCIVMA
jgi:hypothetical protein